MIILMSLFAALTARAQSPRNFVTLEFKPVMQARIIDSYQDPAVVLVAKDSRTSRRVVREIVRMLEASGRPFVRFGRKQLTTNVEGCDEALGGTYPPPHVIDLIERFDRANLPANVMIFLDGLSAMNPAPTAGQLRAIALGLSTRRPGARIFITMTESIYRAALPRGIHAYGLR